MKKTYKNPTLKIVNVKPAQFIATSGQVGLGDSYDGTYSFSSRGSRYSTWEEDAAADYDE